MGLADIPTLVLQRVASGLASPVEFARNAIEDSPVAETGPPTGVKPFKAGEATEAALMAKLGARVFQRARERRLADEKKAKERAAEQYRQQQMDRLNRATAVNEARLAETERHNHAMEARPTGSPPEEMLDTDPDTGKPLPFKMTRDQVLRWRGQNLGEGRAKAARDLSLRLSKERTDRGARSARTLEATRVLGHIPGVADVGRVAWTEALQSADAIAMKAGKPWKPDAASQEKRALVAQQLYPDIFMRHAATVDSLRAGPMSILRNAAQADSADVASQDLIPADLRAIFEGPDE